jgi:hypothetical protein
LEGLSLAQVVLHLPDRLLSHQPFLLLRQRVTLLERQIRFLTKRRYHPQFHPHPPFSPPYSARPSSTRSESRTSNAGARSSSSAKVRTLETGDAVRIESLAVEGVLRYLGEIEGKPGTYAGVELSGAFAGRGKNDGSVAG